MIAWLTSNKEWFFSGIGVFAIGMIIAIFKQKGKKRKIINQEISSGKNSVNIQINRELD